MFSATVEKTVTLEGRGLFSGVPCRAQINPGNADGGITFIQNAAKIRVSAANYVDGQNCSILGDGESTVAVTEHLLAALWCAGVDSAEIEVDGPELPNHDGGAFWQYQQIIKAGVRKTGDKPEFAPAAPICLSSDPYCFIAYAPGPELEVNYLFAHAELGIQTFIAVIDREYCSNYLLPARSFITEKELSAAQQAGLLMNKNESDAVVIRNGVPNKELLFSDEFVRHKVLDLLGDLAVLPFELKGRITACRSGHALNRGLAKQLEEEFNAA